MSPKPSQPSDNSTSIIVPAEPLKAVFTGEVLGAWSNAKGTTDALRHRLEVLTVSGPLAADEHGAARIKWLRARKAAWEVYLEAAFACGMLGGERDAELRSRLVGIDDDGFRSAMAECMTCWFFSGRMKLQVEGVARGRKRKMLDMRVVLSDGEVGVEVKAPFRERPRGTTTWWGNDADKIRQCLESAERQFSKDRMNILVIAPNLRTTMFADRRVLVQAVYGESVIVFDVNAEEGRLENERLEFSPRGKFLNTELPSGKPLKPDGLPAYRRISAVLCIEERVCETHPFPADEFGLAGLRDHGRGELMRIAEKKRGMYFSRDNKTWIGHNVLILHNPFAYHPIPVKPWNEFTQLVPGDDWMEWTDAYDRPV